MARQQILCVDGALMSVFSISASGCYTVNVVKMRYTMTSFQNLISKNIEDTFKKTFFLPA